MEDGRAWGVNLGSGRHSRHFHNLSQVRPGPPFRSSHTCVCGPCPTCERLWNCPFLLAFSPPVLLPTLGDHMLAAVSRQTGRAACMSSSFIIIDPPPVSYPCAVPRSGDLDTAAPGIGCKGAQTGAFERRLQCSCNRSFICTPLPVI